MTRLFLSLSALIVTTAVTAAADLPGRMAPVPPVETGPVAPWSGFYAGVHGAWIRDNGEAERTGVSGVSPEALPTRLGLSDSGLGGGAQIGYLWDLGRFVAGIEADITALDVGRSRSFDGVDGPFVLRTELSSQISWFGTVKGRVGVPMPSLLPIVQQSLVYVTGGLAYAQVEHQGQVMVTPLGLGPQVRREAWTTGFVVGAGTEHQLTETVFLKSETLYYHLQDETLRLARAGDQVNYRFKNDGWISRVGMNVRF